MFVCYIKNMNADFIIRLADRYKINDNVDRDKRNIHLLEHNGWKVIVLWQCALNSEKKSQETLATLIKEIRDN